MLLEKVRDKCAELGPIPVSPEPVQGADAAEPVLATPAAVLGVTAVGTFFSAGFGVGWVNCM